MPNALPRPSLQTSLSQRYAQQSVGGAFNDKAIIEKGNDPLFASYQGATFQLNNGFLTAAKIEVSDFKNNGGGLSRFVKNLNTTPYDAAGIPVAGLS